MKSLLQLLEPEAQESCKSSNMAAGAGSCLQPHTQSRERVQGEATNSQSPSSHRLPPARFHSSSNSVTRRKQVFHTWAGGGHFLTKPPHFKREEQRTDWRKRRRMSGPSGVLMLESGAMLHIYKPSIRGLTQEVCKFNVRLQLSFLTYIFKMWSNSYFTNNQSSSPQYPKRLILHKRLTQRSIHHWL